MTYPTFLESQEIIRTALGKAIEKGLHATIPCNVIICILDNIEDLKLKCEELSLEIERIKDRNLLD